MWQLSVGFPGAGKVERNPTVVRRRLDRSRRELHAVIDGGRPREASRRHPRFEPLDVAETAEPTLHFYPNGVSRLH